MKNWREYEQKLKELKDYEKDVKEVASMITAMMEEFTTEIEQSEYGGG